MARDHRERAECQPPPARGQDPFFRLEFRVHVGTTDCACNLTGPAKDCDIGTALYAASQPRVWGKN